MLRGAGAAEALAVMSTLGSTPLADVGAAAEGPWWFQLYVQADRGFTARLVDDAVAAGATALVLTVDTPLLGARDRDRRTGRAHGGRAAASCTGRCRAVRRPPGEPAVRQNASTTRTSTRA